MDHAELPVVLGYENSLAQSAIRLWNDTHHLLADHKPHTYTDGLLLTELKPGCELEVDGGIDETTTPLTVAAGADVLVGGSSILGASVGVCCAMQRLRKAVSGLAHSAKG